MYKVFPKNSNKISTLRIGQGVITVTLLFIIVSLLATIYIFDPKFLKTMEE